MSIQLQNRRASAVRTTANRSVTGSTDKLEWYERLSGSSEWELAMLFAHLAPGCVAGTASKPRWKPEWTAGQRDLLWVVALGSTIAPDLDVVCNLLVRGGFYHSTLWTHSVFVHLGIGVLWCVLRVSRRWPYLRALIGLAVVGGLSHLALDVIAHGTPLLYPVSMVVIGSAPARVVQGGVWAYLTDPILLLEPLLLGAAAVHWLLCRK